MAAQTMAFGVFVNSSALFPPGHLPDPGIELASLVSPALQVDSLPTEPLAKPSPFFYFLPNSREIYREDPKPGKSGKGSIIEATESYRKAECYRMEELL